MSTTWRLSALLGYYVTPVPAQMRRGPRWFAGSADAIYQNLNLIHDEEPDYVCVFGPRVSHGPRADGPAAHRLGGRRHGRGDPRADLGGRAVRRHRDRSGRPTLAAFREKPADPVGLPDAPDQAFASMGNYVFTACS